MGGIIGMLLAARPGSPIGRLVVNDVGALIPKAAIERISAYVGQDPSFKSLDELEALVRQVLAPFGKLTNEQWRHLTETGSRQRPDGSWGFAYDPGIAAAFRKNPPADVNLWPIWDAITCPTLLLRGAQSDLLLRETALAMTRRGPRAQLVEFEDIGHAPTLMAEDQIKVVREFLLGAGTGNN
jgi:pimeloyl-ACP methyl ester carboxylesterase